jgi:hypothetical protein
VVITSKTKNTVHSNSGFNPKDLKLVLVLVPNPILTTTMRLPPLGVV